MRFLLFLIEIYLACLQQYKISISCRYVLCLMTAVLSVAYVLSMLMLCSTISFYFEPNIGCLFLVYLSGITRVCGARVRFQNVTSTFAADHFNGVFRIVLPVALTKGREGMLEFVSFGSILMRNQGYAPQICY